jgi:putative ABC transport system ATP-binding protein
MKNGNALIRLEGIQKIFLTEEMETHALEDIHLEVRDGEFAEVMGPSGCGKSTLLSLIGLLDTPTEGNYWLDGEPVSDLTASERAQVRNKHIGFIFQAFNLIGDLERVGMSHRMDHYPSQLSGGQRQRVAAARAVVGDPLILLADEPTGNLDSTNGEAVMNLLRELHAEGSTILMVTHDPRYSAYAERTIHLFDGHITDEVTDEARIELAHAGG